MQDSLFSDLSQILPHLANLDSRIQNLRFLARSVEGSTISITLNTQAGLSYVITQDEIPFNLSQEIHKLLEDSIDELQRQHDHLKKLLDETNF